MKPEIYIPGEELWSWFMMNRDTVEKQQILVAKNRETEHEIYVTADEDGFPVLCVYRGDAFLLSEDLLSGIDAVDTLDRLV